MQLKIIIDAKGDDTSILAAKTNFIALKAGDDKIHIENLVNVLTGLNK